MKCTLVSAITNYENRLHFRFPQRHFKQIKTNLNNVQKPFLRLHDRWKYIDCVHDMLLIKRKSRYLCLEGLQARLFRLLSNFYPYARSSNETLVLRSVMYREREPLHRNFVEIFCANTFCMENCNIISSLIINFARLIARPTRYKITSVLES